MVLATGVAVAIATSASATGTGTDATRGPHDRRSPLAVSSGERRHAAYDLGNPSAMCTDGTDVWVANPSRGSVTEFAAATGALVRVIRGANDGLNFPGGIATNGYGRLGRQHLRQVRHRAVGADRRARPSDPGHGVRLSVALQHRRRPASCLGCERARGCGHGALGRHGPARAGDQRPAARTRGPRRDPHERQARVGGERARRLGHRARRGQGALVRIDRARRDGLHAPDALALRGDELFVANGSNTISELAASTGALVRILHGPRLGLNHPVALASDGTMLYVANSTSNSVTELDARTGAVVRRLRGARYRLDDPVGIVTVGARGWVINDAGNSVTGIDLPSGALLRVLTGSARRVR